MNSYAFADTMEPRRPDLVEKVCRRLQELPTTKVFDPRMQNGEIVFEAPNDDAARSILAFIGQLTLKEAEKAGLKLDMS